MVAYKSARLRLLKEEFCFSFHVECWCLWQITGNQGQWGIQMRSSKISLDH